MAMKMRRKSLMSFETTLKALGVMVVLASLPLGQAACGQTPAQAAQRDRSNYAIIIAGYHTDIRHALEMSGLSPYLLDQMEDNARTAGCRQFSSCNRKTADMVGQIGLSTASLVEHLAH